RRASSRGGRGGSSGDRRGGGGDRSGGSRAGGGPAGRGGRPGAPVASAVAAERRLPERFAISILWLLVLVPPFYFAPSAKDPFRLPKLMLAEWLAVASLLPLAWTLLRVEAVGWRDLWRQPAIRATLPLVAVATAGLAVTAHPLHVREALADLWIGAACLAGWSAALPARRLERLLGGLLWPGAALAAIGILQFHGLQALPVARHLGGSRYAVTSTAGNTGDLAAFLVLPCLIAQWRLAAGAGGTAGAPDRERGARPGRGGRAWLVAALAICAYAVALTQTFAALLALLLGSATFWVGARRRDAADWRRLALAAGAVALLAAGVVAGLPALRARVIEKANLVRQGDWNAVLTGRFDGWRAAAWMLGRHPWMGVGHGAYRAEFAPAKLALLDRGVAFHSGQQQNFVNAHDEPLEVAADCGVPGVLALAWGLGVLAVAARARLGPAGAFAVAGLVALGVLSLVDFPFRVALVAFPALLFLAWVMQPAAGEAAA
ncbi:MAG: O-antigen ligase family protein, partial [Acidobacteria bacterium]|nr:O-antigen ligase family protein [Acidobacteriota bacterium]